jgi:putative zinc finger/helix-turn-helix YgiT family protein
MKSPFTGKEMSTRKEKRTFVFRKEEIEIDFHYYFCEETREKFESDELAELNQKQVMNKYRERLKLPFPENIIETRKKYGIPASTMSSILGFGPNTYRNYENGEIPTTSNARLIQLIDDPAEFIRMVNLAQNIEQKTKGKILKKIDQLSANKRIGYPLTEYSSYNIEEPNEFNGYKVFDFDKASNIALFFTEKMKPWKTVLNKLFFFCDFYYFKKYCVSISGLKYIPLSLGPVPDKYDILLAQIESCGSIRVDYVQFPDGNIGEKFIPGINARFNPDSISRSELDTLESVLSKFKHMSAQQIVDISHQEKAWADNYSHKKVISYYFAFEME